MYIHIYETNLYVYIYVHQKKDSAVENKRKLSPKGMIKGGYMTGDPRRQTLGFRDVVKEY